MTRLKVDGDREIVFDHFPAENGTTVLLMHGWALNAQPWDYVIPRFLDGGYGVIAVDGRACGRSDRDFADCSIAAMGSDLVKIADSVAADQLVLNGWSHGGLVTTDAAAKLGPERVAAMILTCSIAPRYYNEGDWNHGADQAGLVGLADALLHDRVAVLEQTTQAMVRPTEANAVHRDWMRQIFFQSGVGQQLRELATVDLTPLVKGLEAPTLVIAGEYDAFTPASLTDHQEQLYPQARKVVLPTGHSPMVEATDDYMTAVEEFLQKVVGSAPAVARS